VVDSLIEFLHTLMGLPIFYPLVVLLIVSDALAPVVPSETVLNLAGAFSASRGVPNVWGVIIAAIIGAIIGDNICFALGAKLIHRVDRLDPDSKAGQAITWVRANMNRGAGAMIIVARFLPWARWVATIVLGSVKAPRAHRPSRSPLSNLYRCTPRLRPGFLLCWCCPRTKFSCARGLRPGETLPVSLERGNLVSGSGQ